MHASARILASDSFCVGKGSCFKFHWQRDFPTVASESSDAARPGRRGRRGLGREATRASAQASLSVTSSGTVPGGSASAPLATHARACPTPEGKGGSGPASPWNRHRFGPAGAASDSPSPAQPPTAR